VLFPGPWWPPPAPPYPRGVPCPPPGASCPPPLPGVPPAPPWPPEVLPVPPWPPAPLRIPAALIVAGVPPEPLFAVVGVLFAAEVPPAAAAVVGLPPVELSAAWVPPGTSPGTTGVPRCTAGGVPPASRATVRNSGFRKSSGCSARAFAFRLIDFWFQAHKLSTFGVRLIDLARAFGFRRIDFSITQRPGPRKRAKDGPGNMQLLY